MADRLRKARTDVGLSQQDMCDRIGISRKTVTNYENGDTRPLRAILNAWAEVTGTYVEWLEHGTRPFPGGMTDGHVTHRKRTDWPVTPLAVAA